MPADRRLRRDHAVQFPRDDPAVDVPDGDRLRQHVRAEALGAGSDDADAARRAVRRSRRAPGRAQVVHGGKESVDALCTHPDVKAVSFVGSFPSASTSTRGTQNRKRVQAMGAKNHAVVMPDANKEQSSTRSSARVRRRGPALHGDLGRGARRRCEAMDPRHRREGEDAQGQRRGTEKGADLGPVISKAKERVLGLIEGRRKARSSSSTVATPRSRATRTATSSRRRCSPA